MTWAGRTRAGLAALVMAVLALSGVTLVSAGAFPGAGHHDVAGSARSGIAEYTPDDHQHGAEWTPTASHRLRPAANVPVRNTVPAEGHALAAVDLVVPAGGEGHGDEASSSVLRV
ncbi:hypothetical protein JIG36_38985 [Actinoplanes sp. LDG1-06]|uniref:Uncharacterized protein n=1 Tax=Paractinoplanes ovalisporus TaxID=2810368 RepID=A0ABS2ANR8_9ACTN|nr:hypothetical protein [Actinoplanes ovalisporus]MBM2621507.1 hypothetical protein [Actinoplanes ovalisporus]